MRTTQINESTNPECFLLEVAAGDYSSNSQIVTGFITPEPLLTIAKKCFDGIMLCAITVDTLDIYWRRDLDVTPIRVASMQLFARVFHNDTWVEQRVSFDYLNDDSINAEVVVAGEKYRVFQDLDALGTDNHLGVEFEFTKGIVDFKFLIHSAGKPVQCVLDTYIIDAALAENRADNRGLSTPGELDGATPTVTPNTPSEGRTLYKHTWERTEPCEATNGRTNVELFIQDAGLSVR